MGEAFINRRGGGSGIEGEAPYSISFLSYDDAKSAAGNTRYKLYYEGLDFTKYTYVYYWNLINTNVYSGYSYGVVKNGKLVESVNTTTNIPTVTITDNAIRLNFGGKSPYPDLYKYQGYVLQIEGDADVSELRTYMFKGEWYE